MYRMALVMVICSACTAGVLPSGGPSSNSSSSGAAESPVITGYRSFVYALCDYYERCETALGPAYSSLEACRAEVDREITINRERYDNETLVFNVDGPRLQECLTELSESMCADRLPAAVLTCTEALAPKTPREPGEACTSQAYQGAPRCVGSSENYCALAPDGTDCGVCARKKENGQACAAAEECLSGFCNNVPIIGNNQCAPIPSGKGAGEGCIDTVECKGNLVCAGAVFQKTCRPRAAGGEACQAARNGDQPECLLDLVCTAGGSGAVCASRLADGQTCRRSGNGQPGCRNFCVFPDAEADEGVCASLAALPGEGQPCAVRSIGGTLVPYCDSHGDLFTEETFVMEGNQRLGASCVCSATRAGGAVCNEDQACSSGTCEGETPMMDGTCKAQLADGAVCTADVDCQSGSCQRMGNMRVCAEPVMCQ